MNGVVEAVIVNHNTSCLAEIAVRSLRWAIGNTGVSELLNVTIVDNHSTDYTADLRRAAEKLAVAWELSRWPAGQQSLTTHGDVLRDFVLARPEAAGYLLVESDMCLHEPDAIAVMLKDLSSQSDLWAVQARMLTKPADDRQLFTELVKRKRRPLDLHAQLTLETDEGDVQQVELVHRGRRIPRCHPGCTLIRNSDAFQLAALHLGFASAWTWSNDALLGGLSDTLGLVSLAMRTHRRRSIVSAASVIHFWHGTRLQLSHHHRMLLTLLRRGAFDEFAAAAATELRSTGLPMKGAEHLHDCGGNV